MKRAIFTVITLFVTCMAFAQPKKKVIIEGIIKGDLEGHNKISLFTRMSKDSTLIKDGKYTFSFDFTGATMQMIFPEYTTARGMMYQPFGILITEPGTYYVTSDIEKGMFESSVVKGPKDAEIYRKYQLDEKKAFTQVYEKINELYGDKWYMINEEDPTYEKLQSSRDSLNRLYFYPVLESLLKSHPNRYASAFVLSSAGREVNPIEKKEAFLAMLSPEMRKSEPAVSFGDHITGLKNSKIGNTVSNFILPDPEGKDVDFSSFKGKYVLIDFWASWCAPCRQSFPHMREVYKKYKGDNFEIYSISIDENRGDWLKAVQEENNPRPQSHDTKNISQSGFAVTGIPTTYLIDPDGKIIMKEIGFDSGGNSEMEKKIREIAESRNGGSGKSIPATRMN